MKWLLGGFAMAALALLTKKRPSMEPSPGLLPMRTEDRPGRHWTWAELSASEAAVRLGLPNTPTAEARANLRWMCAQVLDPLRERYPGVRATSAFRSVAVNRAVGGVADSRHLRGLAVDVVVPAGVQAQIVRQLRGRGLRVLEYAGHLHIAKIR